MAILIGCAGPGGGVYHTVGKGETLWRISHTYGADIQDVAEVNNIKDPTKIELGQKIFIPGARHARKVAPYNTPKKSRSPGRVPRDGGDEGEEPGRIVMEKGRFSWPIEGTVISGYGARGEVMHSGIDIKAPKGSPVKAAADGKVVYSNNNMAGYGNVVIVEHADDYFTVYAHNDRNLVKEGDAVKKGVEVALVGDSGNAATPHLHFEIRRGRKTRNPLFFLP
ncbi:MAG: M23 family metallopeptidase [Deltaproteobacteria bacterium]|nr:M23 family metallopeptidase [Deltaproteobacteria bacterium]